MRKERLEGSGAKTERVVAGRSPTTTVEHNKQRRAVDAAEAASHSLLFSSLYVSRSVSTRSRGHGCSLTVVSPLSAWQRPEKKEAKGQRQQRRLSLRTVLVVPRAPFLSGRASFGRPRMPRSPSCCCAWPFLEKSRRLRNYTETLQRPARQIKFASFSLAQSTLPLPPFYLSPPFIPHPLDVTARGREEGGACRLHCFELGARIVRERHIHYLLSLLMRVI